MTTITLSLPDSLMQRAGGAARATHRPLEEVITAMLESVLPSLDDVPEDMQSDLHPDYDHWLPAATIGISVYTYSVCRGRQAGLREAIVWYSGGLETDGG